MATHDSRLALLDWSLVGQLTSADRAQVAQILLGGLAQDAARVARAVAGLARAGTDEDLIHRHVNVALAGLRWYRPPGPAWAVGLLDTLVRAGVRFPPHLLLFRKAFLTLQGVLSDVCTTCSPEATLMAEALVRLAWEWPLRWWKPLHDRDYATHVSSADLMHLALRLASPFWRAGTLGC
jgi:ubiquinone biosynthesis protein